LEAARPDDLTAAYLTLRKKRDELREQEKQITARMEILATILLNKMAALGQDAFRAVGSTVHSYTFVSASVSDRELLLEHVRNNNAFEFLDLRANKESAVEYEINNGTPPPGVKINRTLKLGVRKSA
jgi:hypothetical protein